VSSRQHPPAQGLQAAFERPACGTGGASADSGSTAIAIAIAVSYYAIRVLESYGFSMI
jgi:hypothetical protein